MQLKDLLSTVSYLDLQLIPDMKVSGVKVDSRRVLRGDLFLALPSVSGLDVDAHVKEAHEKGAGVIVCEEATYNVFSGEVDSCALIRVEDARLAYAQIAAHLFPRQPRHMAAVTGTNGKTSAVYFFRQICEMLGSTAATLGTLGLQAPVAWASDIKTHLTSPDPFTLHATLGNLLDEGVEYVAVEASSHGLEQKRLDGVSFQVGAFTNLSHDHLDYHGSIQNYFDAKKRLFEEVLDPGFTAVINADDFHSEQLLRICHDRQHKIYTYGRRAQEMCIHEVTLTETGQTVSVDFFGHTYEISLPLVGAFQAYNVLCAAGMACGVGFNPKDVVETLGRLVSVPGRVQYIGSTKKGGRVYVDYAHTPHALESVLTSLKPHVKNLLVLVFGCGGNRDKEKRGQMGRIAAEHAQRVIITDDNPRHEDAATIRAQIIKECPGALELPDRAQAIMAAIKSLGEHSICVIAGKGHESGQIVGDTILPFDDAHVAREILQELEGSIA